MPILIDIYECMWNIFIVSQTKASSILHKIGAEKNENLIEFDRILHN